MLPGFKSQCIIFSECKFFITAAIPNSKMYFSDDDILTFLLYNLSSDSFGIYSVTIVGNELPMKLLILNPTIDKTKGLLISDSVLIS